MNILVVSAQKPDSTGSGVYLAETVRAFRAMGHDVAVVAGIDVADDPALPEGTRFFPVRFRTDELPFAVCGMSDEMPYDATRYRDMTPAMVGQFCAAFSAMLRKVLHAFAPDLVICHHLYLVTAVVAEAGLPCPVTAVCHSTDLRQMRSHALERERITRAVRRLDGIFALHEAQKREIVELYGVPESRVRVVGTGYNAAVFREVAGARSTQGVEVAYAGKIWRKKGVESLIRCLDLLPYAPDGFRLRLAGGYSSASELAHMEQLAQRSRYEVEFLGKLSQEDLAAVYNRAQVFVLPSFFEGLPLVVIEALACGCVVVVTDLPGIRGWLSAAVPAAPIVYVEPPRMQSVDEPVSEDLPAFECRLAHALEQAVCLDCTPERAVRLALVSEQAEHLACASCEEGVEAESAPAQGVHLSPTPRDLQTAAQVRALSWESLAVRMLEGWNG